MVRDEEVFLGTSRGPKNAQIMASRIPRRTMSRHPQSTHRGCSFEICTYPRFSDRDPSVSSVIV
ncbi:hypothetical protein FIBSPDRAFT_869777 [Athelia psychrophila]|uniref:Uncharacterized protein n=1 Tax=Athelia psychrophila TaxID=1759441 RepID=A0A166BVQ4_9AGAM|nr:hypothetical protein FIBSPDRAFT_869777 [Fibularhizoctonia sp. CBS 109695]